MKFAICPQERHGVNHQIKKFAKCPSGMKFAICPLPYLLLLIYKFAICPL